MPDPSGSAHGKESVLAGIAALVICADDMRPSACMASEHLISGIPRPLEAGVTGLILSSRGIASSKSFGGRPSDVAQHRRISTSFWPTTALSKKSARASALSVALVEAENYYCIFAGLFMPATANYALYQRLATAASYRNDAGRAAWPLHVLAQAAPWHITSRHRVMTSVKEIAM